MIWGELLWDRFPDGDQLGGAPANVAWHLGQAGGWAQLVSRVGDDDDGRRAIARLSELVDTGLIQIDDERATGEVGVAVVDGEARYTLHPGRAWERIACTPDVEVALAEADVLVYGTLAQRTPAGLASWQRAAAVAARTCLRVCDLNLRPGDRDAPSVREGIAAADVIKLNDKELAALGEWFAWSDPIARLRAPAGRGPRLVALTHGAAGATLFGEDGAVEIPGYPTQPGGDNVGCGDAFLAILVHGLTLGWDLAMSGHAASRYAAAVAGARGATPVFDEARIAALLEPAA